MTIRAIRNPTEYLIKQQKRKVDILLQNEKIKKMNRLRKKRYKLRIENRERIIRELTKKQQKKNKITSLFKEVRDFLQCIYELDNPRNSQIRNSALIDEAIKRNDRYERIKRIMHAERVKNMKKMKTRRK